MTRRAFTLLELLVAVAIASLLIALTLPALGASRAAARAVLCASNQRQLALAWHAYADNHRGLCMPAADPYAAGGVVYWWGQVADSSPPAVLYATGILSPLLADSLREHSVFECPAQPWGSYRPQPIALPPPGVPTSTYGYNGYGLSPPTTPGWSQSIGTQRWKRIDDLASPTDVFVFADALLPGSPPRNTALLDPPMLYSTGQWSPNLSPTTSFRHPGGPVGSTASARADGSVRAAAAERAWLTHPDQLIGSVGTGNAPHYVPDWEAWR
jgi:prepilin-type N-terminal cleavage/methylation domain-containing protein